MVKHVPIEDRFWSKVVISDDMGLCWEWTASRHPRGYGYIGERGKNYRAHRISYELVRGPIPAGLVIDHLCRNAGCVNPWHLEAVTQSENVRRGNAGVHFRELGRAKTHCKHGHEFNEKNTKIRPNGTRACRACGARRALVKYYRQKEGQ